MSVVDELERLGALRNRGELSPEEYARAKAAVLGGSTGAAPRAGAPSGPQGIRSEAPQTTSLLPWWKPYWLSIPLALFLIGPSYHWMKGAWAAFRGDYMLSGDENPAGLFALVVMLVLIWGLPLGAWWAIRTRVVGPRIPPTSSSDGGPANLRYREKASWWQPRWLTMVAAPVSLVVPTLFFRNLGVTRYLVEDTPATVLCLFTSYAFPLAVWYTIRKRVLSSGSPEDQAGKRR